MKAKIIALIGAVALTGIAGTTAVSSMCLKGSAKEYAIPILSQSEDHSSELPGGGASFEGDINTATIKVVFKGISKEEKEKIKVKATVFNNWAQVCGGGMAVKAPVYKSKKDTSKAETFLDITLKSKNKFKKKVYFMGDEGISFLSCDAGNKYEVRSEKYGEDTSFSYKLIVTKKKYLENDTAEITIGDTPITIKAAEGFKWYCSGRYLAREECGDEYVEYYDSDIKVSDEAMLDDWIEEHKIGDFEYKKTNYKKHKFEGKIIHLCFGLLEDGTIDVYILQDVGSENYLEIKTNYSPQKRNGYGFLKEYLIRE